MAYYDAGVNNMSQSEKINWNTLYAEYRSGGLSKIDFSRNKGISKDLVYKHFRIIERSLQNIADAAAEPESESQFALVRIASAEKPQKKATLTLRFEKFSIDVDENTDTDFLCDIIRSLVSLC